MKLLGFKVISNKEYDSMLNTIIRLKEEVNLLELQVESEVSDRRGDLDGAALEGFDFAVDALSEAREEFIKFIAQYRI